MKINTNDLTRAAVFTAILILVQYLTFFTGVRPILINTILAFSAFSAGMPCALFIAGLSPVIAFSLGIGIPIPPFIPVIMLSNIIFTAMCGFFYNRYKSMPIRIAGAASGGFLKYLILYSGATYLLPYFMRTDNAYYKKIAALFSFPQFIFAFAGALTALFIAAVLNRQEARD